MLQLAPEVAVLIVFGYFVAYQLAWTIYWSTALSKIPGPWLPTVTTLWIRWQRWQGRLSLEADKLLARYGPVVRISPNLVLVNDVQTVQKLFARQDLDTAPRAIRALRIGGHDWTVTYPQNSVARERRRPVMAATNSKAMRYWRPLFEKYIDNMVADLATSRGTKSEDIVHHLRIATLRNSAIVMAGSQASLEPKDFPHIVGEYNFLVVWRLCLPGWLFEWLKWSPFSHARFRVRSNDHLYDLGGAIMREARKAGDPEEGAPSTVHKLLVDKTQAQWIDSEMSCEMAGQMLAATETTSSALAFIFYELARRPGLMDDLYEELQTDDNLDNLQLLNACITEGLRFRPPVALTGSRVMPEGGVDVLGYYLPKGTIVTTQSLSLSRQRTDLFPNYDEFDPTRWLDRDEKLLAERRRCMAPFGLGARRCPGGNMATFQMRLILAAVIRAFRITVAPETTPESMEPFEANGYRSRWDKCELIFTPRDLDPQPGPRGCECGSSCDCLECHCFHYTDSHPHE